MKKMGLMLSILTVPFFAQAVNISDKVTTFLLDAGFHRSIHVADSILRSPAGTALIEVFRTQCIEKLTKEEIKAIRSDLDAGSISLVTDDLTGTIVAGWFDGLSEGELLKLKSLVSHLQSKLRLSDSWMHRDIVDDLANAFVCLINKRLNELVYGKNPTTRDYVFGVLLSGKTAHYIKSKALLNLSRLRLAMSHNK